PPRRGRRRSGCCRRRPRAASRPSLSPVPGTSLAREASARRAGQYPSTAKRRARSIPPSSGVRRRRSPASPGGSRRRPGTGGKLLVFETERLADALGERLGRQLRLVALAAQLLDGDVARGEDLGPRDDPRRPVLVPDPDVLELQLEEREPSRRARRSLLYVELVAEIRRVLGQHTEAEEREDGLVLLLQRKLELCLVLVEIVEVGHAGSVYPSEQGFHVAAPGHDEAGSQLGERLEDEAPLVQA